MKICFYSPYIPKHRGGGEKYLFDCARLLQNRHDVSIAITQTALTQAGLTQLEPDKIRKAYESFLGTKLTNITFVLAPLDGFILNKIWWTRQWDVLYYLTDGSFFFSLAKKNILHVQFPFNMKVKSLIQRVNLKTWDIVNTNSEFTKRIIEPAWPITVTLVHQPMVETSNQLIPYDQKKRIILHVGRFFSHLHSKRQDVLVSCFKQLFDTHPTEIKGWKLVLIGSADEPSYAKQVADMTAGYPIEIYHQVSRDELNHWYQQARIYWHATGFGVDETSQPEKVEHFGISTVEAMAAGCVPVVIAKGGQMEILGPALQELLWKTQAECVTITANLISQSATAERLADLAITQAAHFNQVQFAHKLFQMIDH